MKTFVSLLLLNCGLVFLLYSQPTIVKNNISFEYEGHLKDITPNGKQDYQYTYQFKVLNKNADSTLYECKLVKFRLANQYNSGLTTVCSTDSIRNTNFKALDMIVQLALLQAPLKVSVSSRNEVLKIEGVTEAVENAAARWELNVDLKGFLKQLAPGAMQADLNRIFFKLPPEKLHYGYQWKAADSLYYKVTAISGALLYINSSAQPFDNKTKSTRLNVFNEVTGLSEQVKISGTSVIHNGQKIAPLYSYQQVLRYGSAQYPVDTAWINMAIKTNRYLSVAFSNQSGIDSAKLFTYLKAHNATFRHDPTYAVNKLNLVQSVSMTADQYPQYGNILLHTPTRYLKDESSHLQNKMGEVMPLSTDSAYEISKYLVKMPQFKQWLQESFAQHFIEFSEKDITEDENFKSWIKKKNITADSVQKIVSRIKQERTNAKELLMLLHTDKNSLMRQYTDALYLWVEAKEHSHDGGFLIKSSKRLMQMNELQMHRANSNRYSLLVYKLLLNSNKQAEADALLQKTINTLEEFSEDTLNIDRYADKNILAYAWYLKYAAAKGTSTAQALSYLSKAAQCSPKNNTEKAYTSFYDRVFLDSKESYREEFIKVLFDHGDDQEALRVFVEHINAEPESLDEMQKTYEAHFPERSFKQFFTQNVISAWSTAPAFILKGIDGINYSLNDFKNTWLVLDFWGTWCPPCRREMPELNTFNKELKEGKHNGVAFLSIACRDTEGNVKSFLESNKYALSVVMSNDIVEKEYNINSYPSKVMVSPNGKMLTLKYGDDWKVIVEKFTDLYTVL